MANKDLKDKFGDSDDLIDLVSSDSEPEACDDSEKTEIYSNSNEHSIPGSSKSENSDIKSKDPANIAENSPSDKIPGIRSTDLEAFKAKFVSKDESAMDFQETSYSEETEGLKSTHFEVSKANSPDDGLRKCLENSHTEINLETSNINLSTETNSSAKDSLNLPENSEIPIKNFSGTSEESKTEIAAPESTKFDTITEASEDASTYQTDLVAPENSKPTDLKMAEEALRLNSSPTDFENAEETLKMDLNQNSEEMPEDGSIVPSKLETNEENLSPNQDDSLEPSKIAQIEDLKERSSSELKNFAVVEESSKKRSSPEFSVISKSLPVADQKVLKTTLEASDSSDLPDVLKMPANFANSMESLDSAESDKVSANFATLVNTSKSLDLAESDKLTENLPISMKTSENLDPNEVPENFTNVMKTSKTENHDPAVSKMFANATDTSDALEAESDKISDNFGNSMKISEVLDPEIRSVLDSRNLQNSPESSKDNDENNAGPTLIEVLIVLMIIKCPKYRFRP